MLNPVSVLEIVLTAMAVAIALFGGILVSTNPRSKDRSAGLSIFLFINAVDALDSLLAASDAYAFAPHLIGFSWPWPILYGPAIYLYGKAMTSRDKIVMKGRERVLFVAPALAGLVFATPFYLLPADKKIMLAKANIAAVSEVSAPLQLGAIGLNVLFFAVSLFYLIALFRLLTRHTRRVRDIFSNIEDKSLNWLRWVMFILIAAWIWAGVLAWWSANGSAPAWQAPIQALFQLCWIVGFAYFGTLQGPVFKESGEQRVVASEPAPAKYARSALDAQRMEKIAGKLEAAMQEEALYADSSLNLRRLSERTGVSENYISQTLNACLGQNFFDYVNARRIEAAKQLLIETDLTVLSIALQVGFNSRSTFNAAFQKHANQAPSKFRAESRI